MSADKRASAPAESLASTGPVNWADFGYDSERAAEMPAGWVHVATLSDRDGCDWAVLHAFWSPVARRYFWHGDRGCWWFRSTWSDGVRSEVDFDTGDRADLLRAIRAFAIDYGHTLTAVDAADAAAAVQDFREVTR